MTRKRKRRSSVVEIGNGPARIKIYTMNRRDGYPEFTLSWKEAGRRKTRSFASIDEARMVAQQISVRLANGWTAADEATRRDIDLLRHCEQVAQEHGVGLAAAMDEWASARKAAGEIPLSDAVRFYQANRKDLLIQRTLAQVVEEFIESRRANGSSEIHVRNCRDYLGRLTGQIRANIADVTTAELNKFIRSQKTLGPVSRNSLRGAISTDFYPTLLELCGLDPLPGQHVDGVSFAKLLMDPKASHDRPPLFWHYPHWGNSGGIPYSAIRNGDWKLIRYYWKKEPELFNLANDLGERKNLAQVNREKFDELSAKLDAMLKDTDALLPFPNPKPAKRPLTKW